MFRGMRIASQRRIYAHCVSQLYTICIWMILLFFCSSFAFKIRLVVLCDFHQFFIIIINPLSFLYVYVYC